MYRNIYVVLENIEKARRDSGHEQFLCIVDLDGFEFYKWMNYDCTLEFIHSCVKWWIILLILIGWILAAFQMVVQVFKLFEGNYPETLYKAVAINGTKILNCFTLGLI